MCRERLVLLCLVSLCAAGGAATDSDACFIPDKPLTDLVERNTDRVVLDQNRLSSGGLCIKQVSTGGRSALDLGEIVVEAGCDLSLISTNDITIAVAAITVRGNFTIRSCGFRLTFAMRGLSGVTVEKEGVLRIYGSSAKYISAPLLETSYVGDNTVVVPPTQVSDWPVGSAVVVTSTSLSETERDHQGEKTTIQEIFTNGTIVFSSSLKKEYSGVGDIPFERFAAIMLLLNRSVTFTGTAYSLLAQSHGYMFLDNVLIHGAGAHFQWEVTEQAVVYNAESEGMLRNSVVFDRSEVENNYLNLTGKSERTIIYGTELTKVNEIETREKRATAFEDLAILLDELMPRQTWYDPCGECEQSDPEGKCIHEVKLAGEEEARFYRREPSIMSISWKDKKRDPFVLSLRGILVGAESVDPSRIFDVKEAEVVVGPSGFSWFIHAGESTTERLQTIAIDPIRVQGNPLTVVGFSLHLQSAEGNVTVSRSRRVNNGVEEGKKRFKKVEEFAELRTCPDGECFFVDYGGAPADRAKEVALYLVPQIPKEEKRFVSGTTDVLVSQPGEWEIVIELSGEYILGVRKDYDADSKLDSACLWKEEDAEAEQAPYERQAFAYCSVSLCLEEGVGGGQVPCSSATTVNSCRELADTSQSNFNWNEATKTCRIVPESCTPHTASIEPFSWWVLYYKLETAVPATKTPDTPLPLTLMPSTSAPVTNPVRMDPDEQGTITEAPTSSGRETIGDIGIIGITVGGVLLAICITYAVRRSRKTQTIADSILDGQSTENFLLSHEMSAIVGGVNWKMGRLLGKGAFGSVYEAVTPAGKIAAVKVLPLVGDGGSDGVHTTGTGSGTDQLTTEALSEVERMKELDHPQIVKLIAAEIVGDHLCIVMEHLAGGSLAGFITASGGSLELKVAKGFTRQIVSGLRYLHDNSIIHRDIKGGNVLLSAEGAAKLSDFGCSRCITESQKQQAKTVTGTPLWMAPEVVMQEEGEAYDFKADIWSLGCTVCEMLTGKPPWPEFASAYAALYHVAHEEPTLPDVDDETTAFLVPLLQKDPAKRPSADKVSRMPWLS